jgi:hypothetical protein
MQKTYAGVITKREKDPGILMIGKIEGQKL